MSTIIKKIILAIVAMFCMVVGARAQCNPGTSITLQSQTDVDAFAAQYNGCANLIVGEVNIYEDWNGSALDVSGIHIPTITGDVNFCGVYGNFDVQTIIGNVHFADCQFGSVCNVHFLSPATVTGNVDSYTSTYTLANIEHIGGSLQCNNDLYMFEDVKTIGNNLDVKGQVSNLMANLTMVGGRIEIWNNALITQIAGFNNLQSVGTNIKISSNPNLTSITGFGSTTLANTQLNALEVEVQGNPLLAHISGFNNLHSVINNGIARLIVISNPTLLDINGFNNLNSVDWLTIIQNDALLSIDGFNTPNTNGNVSVKLDISQNNALQTLNGFGCFYTTSDLYIGQNSLLQTINGFNNLNQLTNILQVGFNNALANIVGFNALTTSHYLLINTNNALQNFTGFQHLTNAYFITIEDNSSLVSLDGLSGLLNTNVLQIMNNDALINTNGLHHLQTSFGGISLWNNDNLQTLTDLGGLTDANISINNNPVLNDITNMNIATNFWSIGLENNPNLTYCHVPAVCNHLALGRTATITGNATGCTSVPIVQAQCMPPPCTLTATITGNTSICMGGTTTQLCAIPSGGCTPYMYTWSDGSQIQCINASAGCYEVTITDCNGCTFIANTCVTEMTATITGNTNVCAGQTTQLCANAINGYAPFTYSWTGATTANTQCINVGIGNYNVQVTDATGCIASVAHTIISPTPTTKNWYFGYGAGLTFASGNPVAIVTSNSVNTWEGTAVAEDASGNLLFYTDGNHVWDACHNLVTTLGLTTASTTQAATILPVVGSTTDFYIFSVEDATTTNKYAYYTKISTTGGVITVVGAPNTILSAFDAGESLAIMPHANGTDSWVITGERNTTQMSAYLVSSAGVSNTPVVSTTNNTNVLNGFGASKVHCIASLLARARTIGGGTNGSNGWAVYDMNKTTGVITLKHDFTDPAYVYPYGVEFAPSGKLLYGSDAKGDGLYQFNLGTNLQTAHWNSFVTVGSYSNSGALQIASDGKIYMAADQHASIHVINNPDNGGTACNFAPNSIPLTFNSGLGLPTQAVANCTPVATENKDKTTAIFTTQPNPTTGIVNISLSRLSEAEMNVSVSNLQGIVLENQKLYKGTATTEFDLSKYPSGLYFITIQTADGERVTQKVVKE